MSYQVRFSELNNPQKTTIVVEDQTLNTETSLTFVGKNYAGYAQFVAENFLHLLENFARSTAPSNPVQGQLWFDNTAGVNQLKVFDGTTWTAAGSVKKAPVAPTVSNSIKGDLWVDTDNQQLYMFSGSNWVLIGPQFSGGLKTGPNVETIVDTSNNVHGVISLYSDGDLIAIISNVSFAPKSAITGFEVIGKGLNISSVDVSSTSSPMKMWGVASKADALVVNNTVVPSTSFLRSDQVSTTNNGLNVRSNSGISLGGDLSFNIGTDVNSAVLYSKTSNSVIDFKLTLASGDPKTVIRINSTENITNVGINKTNPNESLDVSGKIRSDEGIVVTGTGTDSITTAGGLIVAGASNLKGQITNEAPMIINYLDTNGNPRSDNPVIAPGSVAAHMKYDIGSPTKSFRNIYAETFVGNFSGTFSGALTGNISGTAARLASSTLFQLVGDVTSNQINFNGQTSDGTATFQTVIGQDMIGAREEVGSAFQTDQLLILRPNLGLRKISKQTLFASAATVPTGSILPFGGQTAPAGYLLCDGSEVRISEFPLLFSVIGYAFRDVSLLQGASTFALPDLRGRFPLGRDNMDNGRTIPSKDNSTILIDAGGGIADRVTDTTADIIGAASGNEQRSLAINNIPEHEHDFRGTRPNGAVGNQYYAIRNVPGAPIDNGIPAQGATGSNGSAQALGSSGGILTDDLPVKDLATPFNTMNPYQTVNYIIYTGIL
jgi:microcystin-dependent protein